MQPIIVTTSCDKKEDALRIAALMLEMRLCACAQISAEVSSSYWWEGKIVSDTEYLLKMKSSRQHFAELSRQLKKVHPYDVPEISATELVEIDQDYLKWLREELREVM